MSTVHLCLNCWRTPSNEALYYRCDACGDRDLPAWMQRPGDGEGLRRVQTLKRPWYRRLLSDSSGPPQCPKHPSANLKLFCRCGYPLTERAALEQSTPFALGIAGPRSAGKTVYLITLMNEIRRLEIGRRKLGLVGLDDTEERLHQLAAGFYDHGEKPRATPPALSEAPAWEKGQHHANSGQGNSGHGNFGWTLTLDDGRRRPTPPMLIVASDVGGETWNLPGHQRQAFFDRYLDLVGSLILLVDGMALAADLGIAVEDAWDAHPPAGDRGAETRQHFSRVLERLGPRARRVDLAVAVSKADVLWQHGVLEKNPLTASGKRRRRALAKPDPDNAIEKALFDSQRRDIVVEARRRFRSVGLFAFSSLGFLPAGDDVDEDVRLRRRAEPEGVSAPFVWLLEKRLKFS